MHPQNHPDQIRIVLGVSGGIAAYKTAELARLLTKHGYRVFPIMTPWATKFIGPLTLESLTGNPVQIETPGNQTAGGIEHISLIRGANMLLIAPLTANTLAKMVQGMADNFLTASYLAHRGKTVVCPAMNTGMLEHPATRRNLAQLEEDGVFICDGEAGELACGEIGAGRMAEPPVILDFVSSLLEPKIPQLMGRRVLVTAGATREDLDPVRFLTNRSSGKMGIAVARAFRDAGGDVTLVHGHVTAPLPGRIQTIEVRRAADMEARVLERADAMDIMIMTAAVADYRPVPSPQKLKKDAFDGVVHMERTVDILAALGNRKKPEQLLVGFAAETENLIENARGKLQRKNADIIFANDVSGEDLGFGSDTNHIHAVGSDGQVEDLGVLHKDLLARHILRVIVEKMQPS